MFLDLVHECLGESKRAEEEERFRCPFCGDTKQRLYFSTEDPYLWHCKHCDEAGNAISFVMKYYETDYGDAISILEEYDYFLDGNEDREFDKKYHEDDLTVAEKMLLALVNKEDNTETEEVINYTVPTFPTNFKLLINNMDNPEAYPYFTYLASRGVTLEEVKKHLIGYVKEGLITMPSGKEIHLKRSVVFVTTKDKYTPIYWNTRAIDKNAYIKSINAPASETEYSKRNVIFNLDRARETEYIVIYEGVFNALMSGVHGVATFGKQVTNEQVALLVDTLKVNPNMKFIVALDDDAKVQADDLARRLYEYTDNVFLLSYPNGKDANEMGRETTQRLVDEALPYRTGGNLRLFLNSL